jgi:hypothetical protein
MQVQPLLVALLVLSAGAALAADKAPKERSAADVLGGNDVVATIRSAEKVVVFRLKDATYEETPDKYAVTSGPHKFDAALARKLADTVTAYRNCERDAAPACDPLYGMRTTTFIHDKSKVDVVYCFSCDLLTVYHNGKRVGSGYFEPSRADLVRLAKQLLPKDAAIQKLK